MSAFEQGSDGVARGRRQIRLSRRRLLGAGAALAASSALLLSRPARTEASPISPDDVSTAFRLPVDDLSLGWTLPLVDGATVAVPYITQLDGSREERANCGPASLAMVLGQYGDHTSIADLRKSINQYMGIWSKDNGSTWEALAHAASTRGYDVAGLFGGAGSYRRWTVDDLAEQTILGHAVIILVRYRALPGHETSAYQYNHYIVVVGLDSEGYIVYHDPACPDALTGAYLRMSPHQLKVAWSTVSSGIVNSGMTVTPRARS